MTGPAGFTQGAAYNPYELLRAIIDRVGWPTEAEKTAAHASVSQMEQLRVFGTYASTMTCDHPEEDVTPRGICQACGKAVASAPSYRSRY